MSNQKQSITKPFSRLKNGLVELQRWWPAFVKNDGVGGLTVDPMLYSTGFGPNTKSDEGGLNSENDTPGVRVEAINDDGTVAKGDDNSEVFTVTISGAGTFAPLCTVNQAGIETKFYLVAPSKDTRSNAESEYGYTTSTNARSHAGSLAVTENAGPYPVFMTVQEFAEMLDTYRHIGTNDDEKVAFLPHGSVGGGRHSTSSASANPAVASDPRISSNTNWPADDSSANLSQTQIRATVFMPMMLDNNQFDKRITGADVSFNTPRALQLDSTDLTGPLTATGEGITRYDSNPTGSDSATIRYKNLGYSGDHLTGKVGAWSLFRGTGSSEFYNTHNPTNIQHYGYSNADLSLDSTPSLGPKYRMRMALACFLKNGTYDITDGGDLIPYIYDPDRVIGGKNTMTLYQVWNGKDGYDAADSDPTHDCDAQIYPMFDFVQGPACPANQGQNASYDSVFGIMRAAPNLKLVRTGSTYNNNMSEQGRMLEVRPNPRRLRVFGIEFTTGDTSSGGRIKIYFETLGSSNSQRMAFDQGMPVYIDGMTGIYGGDNTNKDFYPDTWLANLSDVDANQTAADSVNLNGWWIVCANPATEQTVTYDSLFGDGDTNTVRYNVVEIKTLNKFYPSSSSTLYRIGSSGSPSTAYIRQGRMPGYASSRFYLTGVKAQYQVQNPASALTFDDGSGNRFSLPGTGSWSIGAMSSDTNMPSNNNDTFPGRPTVYKSTRADQAGNYDSDNQLTERTIGPRKADDSTFSISPTVAGKNGGSLRLPPPVGWDLAFCYYCTPGGAFGSGSTLDTTNAYGDTIYSGGQQQFNTRLWFKDISGSEQSREPSLDRGRMARWAYRGITIPFWSYMETTSGRHAWDHIKPVSASGTWLYGRNRPWPAHERLGTHYGVGPSLLKTAKQLGADGKSYDGWDGYNATGNYVDAGEATTKIGVSEMGCSPIWLDMEIRGWFPVQDNRMTLIEFDNNIEYPVTGRHSMITEAASNAGQFGFGFYPFSTDGTKQFSSVATSGNVLLGKTNDVSVQPYLQTRRPTFSLNRPGIYIWGDSSFFKEGQDGGSGWSNSQTWPFNPSYKLGWGLLGNQVGTGGGMALTEGTHTLRTVFTDAGMTMLVDGANKGTDPNGSEPVWGMTIKACDAMANTYASEYPTTLTKSNSEQYRTDSPNALVSSKDLQIDQIKLRQIPSPAMLPFNVDTVTQNITGIAKYRNLTIEAENISSTNGMTVKVSIMEVPTTPAGRPQAEATTVVSGFEELDPGFVAGVGVIDLENLPAAQLTNGFVIRYHFYIPDNTQTDLHPINWNAIPIIRSWTLNYDEKPTSSLSVVGNSFNGDVSSPIATEVGHIISFRGTGTTTDDERLISQIKFDFGDGSSTGFLDFADQTLQSTTYDVAHVYSKSGTYSATVTVKDDNGNESVASSAISVVVAEVKPVALIRAIPQMVRAGQAITFDASESYTLSSDTARTIASYTFDFGDGSSTVSGSSPTASHTYAAAGEYMATVTATDNDSPANTSTAAKCVVKILPATLVVPLTLNTKPRKFSRTRRAEFKRTSVLDTIYPEMSDLGQRSDEFTLEGSFLKETANADIDYMEELLVSGALVEFEYEDVNYSGTPTNKKFVGRMTSFDYQREGGRHGETPYSATFVREAGLGN